jgi:hypothetical protein
VFVARDNGFGSATVLPTVQPSGCSQPTHVPFIEQPAAGQRLLYDNGTFTRQTGLRKPTHPLQNRRLGMFLPIIFWNCTLKNSFLNSGVGKTNAPKSCFEPALCQDL